VTSFDGVADVYDAARPTYPDAVYDALEPIAGAVVLEGGAGTGIATRALHDRGGRVIPFDIGPMILRIALTRTPGLTPVVADGASLPFRDTCADLVCFAQSWHWLDPSRRCRESARVLRDAGRWAGWWSHARADGDPWFDAHWDAVEAVCTGTTRAQRDIDWADGVRESGLFAVGERITVRWVRELSVERWLNDVRTTSYVCALSEPDRLALMDELATLTRNRFPAGEMPVPYETWLWIATKR